MRYVNIVLVVALLFFLASCATETRSITDTQVSENGHLIIAYSDGTEEDLGLVVGEDGSDGIDGQNGINGLEGLNGQDGANGIDGIEGEQGSPGSTGLSAYELWLEFPENEGKTIEEFFDSLIGQIDPTVEQELMNQINDFRLMCDLYELRIWLEANPRTYVTGEQFMISDLPELPFGSIVEESNHVFDYLENNNIVTLTVSFQDITEIVTVEYIVLMNQEELDEMYQGYVDEDAQVMQSWLNILPSELMFGYTITDYPTLPNGSIVTPGSIIIDGFDTQDVYLTLTNGTATAEVYRWFVVVN